MLAFARKYNQTNIYVVVKYPIVFPNDLKSYDVSKSTNNLQYKDTKHKSGLNCKVTFIGLDRMKIDNPNRINFSNKWFISADGFVSELFNVMRV